MRPNPYHNYLENEILTADPLKLVVLLYRGALGSIADARRYLASGEIGARSQSISIAVEIIAELIRTLDYEAGGDLSNSLARLYDYTLHRLAEGNGRQSDAPLAEAERIMASLLEAWQQCTPPEDFARAERASEKPTAGETAMRDSHLSCAY